MFEAKISAKEAINGFAFELTLHERVKSKIIIAISDLEIYDTLAEKGIKEYKNEIFFPEKSTVDLILCDFPLAMDFVVVNIGGAELRIRRNWQYIWYSIQYLSSDGIGVFLAEGDGFSSGNGRTFTQRLSDFGYHFNGFIEIPEGLIPRSSIRPITPIISRKCTDKIMIGSIESPEDCLTTSANLSDFLDNNINTHLETIDRGQFRSFERIRAEKAILALENGYQNYRKVRLSEFCISIINGGKVPENAVDAETLYLRRMHPFKTASSRNAVTGNIRNWIRIDFDDKLLKTYFEAFFQSKTGELILKSVSVGSSFYYDKS